MLQAIVPSHQMTGDITVRFGGNGNLYAGILRTPFTDLDAQGNPIPRLNILRTGNVLSGAEMSVLVDRTGAGVDQPYIQAAAVGGRDVVFCGDNDFNQSPVSANMDFSQDGAGALPQFKTTVVDVRSTEGDAPSIRPVIQIDGTVYGAFLERISGTTAADLRYNVAVVRDDSFARNNPLFAALTDPGDGRAGRIVAPNRLIPFMNEPILGQGGSEARSPLWSIHEPARAERYMLPGPIVWARTTTRFTWFVPATGVKIGRPIC
jgi:hypothetical protein